MDGRPNRRSKVAFLNSSRVTRKDPKKENQSNISEDHTFSMNFIPLFLVRGHCVVFLGKTLNSHGASLHPGV